MLEKVKKSLRIKSDAFDDEISDLIDSARLDLKISNISDEVANGNDLLIQRAIVLYCQMHFGVEVIDFNRVSKMYESLKIHLGLSGDYIE